MVGREEEATRGCVGAERCWQPRVPAHPTRPEENEKEEKKKPLHIPVGW